MSGTVVDTVSHFRTNRITAHRTRRRWPARFAEPGVSRHRAELDNKLASIIFTP